VRNARRTCNHPGVPELLVTTAVAAQALNVHPSTVRRWIDAGMVTPTDRTAGGHARWSVADLRRQVAAVLEARVQDPEGSPAESQPAVEIVEADKIDISRHYEDQIEPTAEREEPFTTAQAAGLISSGQAAEIVGATKAALSKWARQGLITPTERVGKRGDARWDVDDLKRQLAENNLSGKRK
jgi:DNA-binding transcriptional MerR regulator